MFAHVQLNVYNSCNMCTSVLPNMCTSSLGSVALGTRVYISGRILMPMHACYNQLLHVATGSMVYVWGGPN